MARPQDGTSSKYSRISKIHFVVLMAEWELGTLLRVCRRYSHMDDVAKKRQVPFLSALQSGAEAAVIDRVRGVFLSRPRTASDAFAQMTAPADRRNRRLLRIGAGRQFMGRHVE
jgi:hypothetical protein